MPSASQGVTVEPNAQTVVVTIAESGGGTPVVYADRHAQFTISMPATISTRTTFFLADPATFTVSAKVGGLENANGNGGTTTVDLTGGGIASVGVGVPTETPTLASATYPSFTDLGKTKLATADAGELLRLRAMLGGYKTAPVNVFFIGHSIAAGYSATSYANRFADSAVTALRRHMGVTGGLGFKKAYRSDTLTDYPIALTGTVLTVNDLGPGAGTGVHLGTSYVTAATITVPAGHTSIDIMWGREGGAGSFTYTVDGGAASGAISTSGTLSRWQTTRVTLSAGSAHTVVVNPSSGISRFGGVFFYAGDETSGIRSIEGANPGSRSDQYLATITNSAVNNWLDLVTATQPAALVVTLLCNDYISANGTAGTNNIASATTKANIKAIVDGIAAKCTKRPSVILCVENLRNDVDSGMTPEKWANYVQAAYDLATTEGYAVFDWWRRIGSPTLASTSQTAGLLNADNVHPSDAGHILWGEGLGRFLAPQ